jgi:hypothetical protein
MIDNNANCGATLNDGSRGNWWGISGAMIVANKMTKAETRLMRAGGVGFTLRAMMGHGGGVGILVFIRIISPVRTSV